MPLTIGTELPPFIGAMGWLNGTHEATPQDRPTLVQFWAISCPICKINLPRLQEFLETDAIISDQQTPREKFEQARLSRRAALRKIGITSGMALFGMFAVDDLARMAIKKMEENTQTHEIGETVAKEFKNMGVAFAAAPGSSSNDACGNDQGTVNCEKCQDQHYQACLKNKSAAVCYNRSVACETHCNDTTADAASLKACWGSLG